MWWWYGFGSEVWWVGAAIGCVTALWVSEESGHEILLDGEVEAEQVLNEAGEVISTEKVNSSISATQHDIGS